MIADLLANNYHLKYLDIGANRLGKKCSKALADALLINSCLLELRIERNAELESQGLMSLRTTADDDKGAGYFLSSTLSD
eukprot:767963-Hanusia_phi.AAC.4